MHDWLVFAPKFCKRVMAKFLLRDALDHPALNLQGNAGQARLVSRLLGLARGEGGGEGGAVPMETE